MYFYSPWQTLTKAGDFETNIFLYFKSGCQNYSEGLKHFMLNVKPDYVDKFHEELEKMAA